jgi:GT2 family glycosyltransferase
VAVVFAVCNHRATLPALLAALERTDWPELQIVAVDCGSTDGSLALLRQRAAASGLPFTLLERHGAGRATALQAGFDAAGTADVVRLHADVVPDGTEWLHGLHRVLIQHPECGIVGAKIALATGRLQSCGRSLISGLGTAGDWSNLRWQEGDRDETSRPTEVDGVAGELCWIRRAVLDQTGGLDTNFDPVFGDDDDLCLRARWHGFAVFVEPAVRGVHFGPRWTPSTNASVVEPSGQLERWLTNRTSLTTAHRDYWQRKWGYDPAAPDLHEVRRRYGHTRICWRIGARLTERLATQPAVDACLVTWNSRHLLPRMLDALAKTRYPHLEVWIADNGSTDGTREYLAARRADFPFPLHVLELPQNMGVAQGLNVAFAAGKAPLVARLDDDTIVSPEWLERLVPRFHQRPYAGMVGPAIDNDNEGAGLQAGPCREWPTGLPGNRAQDHGVAQGLVRVVTVRGCCNLYRRSVFATIGLLDVRFSPSQFDEWDHHIALCVAGYESLYDGSVTVRHQLTQGRVATPAARANSFGNHAKSRGKWSPDHIEALHRGIDLSLDGRLLPPDGDTSALRAALPPVPTTPPAPVPREPSELAELAAKARRCSLLRSLDGPLAPWWRYQLEFAEEAQRLGDPRSTAIAASAQDLWSHEPRSLLLVARQWAAEGELRRARTLAERALWLAPDQPEIALAVAEVAGRRGVPASARRPSDDHTATQVVLLPPLDDHQEHAQRAARLARAALHSVGVAAKIETHLTPELRGAKVVHAFGLADAPTLLGRLQVVRAMAPRARIVLSPLAGDAGRARWLEQVLGGNQLHSANDLRSLFAAIAQGKVRLAGSTAGRYDPPEPEHAHRYEARCLSFADALLVHRPADQHWLAERHHALPPCHCLPEGVPVAAADLPAPVDLPARGALFVGALDLAEGHVAALLALHGTGLPLTLCGRSHPLIAGWHLRTLGDGNVHWRSPLDDVELAAALARSAVLLWLPSAPVSWAVPLQAALAGCGLVLPKDLGAEAVFGELASYVDPADLPSLRAAALAEAARARDPAREPAREALRAAASLQHYGAALAGIHGLLPACIVPRQTHPTPGSVLQPA